jgi:hypothetical protein
MRTYSLSSSTGTVYNTITITKPGNCVVRQSICLTQTDGTSMNALSICPFYWPQTLPKSRRMTVAFQALDMTSNSLGIEGTSWQWEDIKCGKNLGITHHLHIIVLCLMSHNLTCLVIQASMQLTGPGVYK